QIIRMHAEGAGRIALRIMRLFLCAAVLVLKMGVVHETSLMLDTADRETERVEHLSHPHGVTARQIVVHGNQVRALSRKRVQVERGGRSQRLSFALADFGDPAAM